MAAPLEDSVRFFVEQVFANETLLQSERKALLQSAVIALKGDEAQVEQVFQEKPGQPECKTTMLSMLLLLSDGITAGVDRWGKSMQIGRMGQEAMRLGKKNRTE